MPFIIIEQIVLRHKSWIQYILYRKATIRVQEIEFSVGTGIEILNRVIETEDDEVELTLRSPWDSMIMVRRRIQLLEGFNVADLESEKFYCSVVLRKVDNIWKFLDSDIEKFGEYKGSPYFSNTKTLETSFSRSFISEKNSFPSFTRHILGDKTYYVDSVNKIVIAVRPSARQNIVKERLYSVLSGKSISLRRGSVRFVIERDNLLQSGASVLLKNVERLRSLTPIFVFKYEIGEDYGAIRREFFFLAFNSILQNQRMHAVDGLIDVLPGSFCPPFIYDYDHAPEAIRDVLMETESIDDDRVFFIFLGVLLGSFVLFRETISVNFALSFYENLLNCSYTARHVQDVEFLRTIVRCTRDPALSEYTLECLREAIEQKLVGGRKDQYAYIRLGFIAVFPEKFENITAFDFPFIFYNFVPITVERLMKYVYYERCSPDTPEIQWMWAILGTKDSGYLTKFLMFFTGSGVLPRFDEEMRMYVEKVNMRSSLMTASSCAKRLFITSYKSKEEMEYYMDYSILNAAGFHKV